MYATRTYRLSIGPGETTEVGTSGFCVTIRAVSTVVEVEAEGQGRVEMAAGETVKFPQQFQRLLIRNPAPDAQEVVLVAGSAEYTPAMAGTVNVAPPAGLDDLADVVTGVGVTLVAPARDGRTEVMISSLPTNGSDVRIGATPAADRGIPVQPGQTITLSTAAEVCAYSPDAGQVLAVLEVVR